ncbi:MAG: hypothetical protein MUE54_02480 [Anaerolineae bacterium]|nr:hypothetical protein [Anaerolineae bacterium]
MTTTTSPKKKSISAKMSFRYAMLFIVGMTLLLFLMGMLLILEASPIALLPEQVSIIGDIFIIILMLCPLMICGIPLYIALGASVFGLIRVDSGTRFRLRKWQHNTKNMQQNAEKLTQSLAKQSIRVNSRAEFLRPLFRLFDKPEDKQDNGKQ